MRDLPKASRGNPNKIVIWLLRYARKSYGLSEAKNLKSKKRFCELQNLVRNFVIARQFERSENNEAIHLGLVKLARIADFKANLNAIIYRFAFGTLIFIYLLNSRDLDGCFTAFAKQGEAEFLYSILRIATKILRICRACKQVSQ
ncbi:hypothetical protein ACWIUD_03675 [Helicobacter sp. 23-1044]